MQKLEIFLDENPGKVFFILLALAIPPFFINLGLLPLFADEPTRANVALEMILSKNFAVPTVGGEFYYNKPPFYNWVLSVFYLLGNGYTEFLTRLPAEIPLFLFAATIYLSASHFLKDKKVAALSGLLFLVNGRMLIYDSMLGHIDIFYSWLTFISFMAIFYFYQKNQWFWLFFTSYLLTAITFLCKGLPSIVFQGFTLIALVAYTNNWKRFFSWQHILSGIVCLLLIGSYFYNYSMYNLYVGDYFKTIWDQSSQRTATKYSAWENIKYVISFPIEHLVHLFPASLLVIFCFNRRFWKWLNENPFLKFSAIIFMANIWVYWLSPQTRPRYILMLYPLIFMIWSHAYYTFKSEMPKANRVFNIILILVCIAVTTAIPAAFFFNLSEIVPHLGFKLVFLFLLGCLTTLTIIKIKDQKMMVFIAMLLIVRLGFSWLVIPHRLHDSESNYYKIAAIEMGEIANKEPFYFYHYHPDALAIPFYDRLIFYIQRTRMEKVKLTETASLPGYYLTFDENFKNPKAVLVKSYQSNLKLYHIK